MIRFEAIARQPGIFRLFLAIVVVVNHATPLALGAWAVYVFFILSGYWVTLMLDQKYSQLRHPIRTFYLSRYWRLFPVFALCTLLMALYLRLEHSKDLRTISFFWALRSIPIVGITSQPLPLAPAWSIDYEAQFYLFLPLLALLFGCFSKSHRSLVILSLAIFLAPLLYINLERRAILSYFGLLHCLPFFLIGMAIFYAPASGTSRVKAWSSLGAFAGTVIITACVPGSRGVTLDLLSYPHYRLVPNWAFCAALAVLVTPFVRYSVQWRSSIADRHLSNLAYPVYLFHWIPQAFVSVHYGHLTASAKAPYVVIQMLIVAAGSLLIYVCVDRPSERLREQWLKSLKI